MQEYERIYWKKLQNNQKDIETAKQGEEERGRKSLV